MNELNPYELPLGSRIEFDQSGLQGIGTIVGRVDDIYSVHVEKILGKHAGTSIYAICHSPMDGTAPGQEGVNEYWNVGPSAIMHAIPNLEQAPLEL